MTKTLSMLLPIRPKPEHNPSWRRSQEDEFPASEIMPTGKAKNVSAQIQRLVDSGTGFHPSDQSFRRDRTCR
jgi:hypothetical protein